MHNFRQWLRLVEGIERIRGPISTNAFHGTFHEADITRFDPWTHFGSWSAAAERLVALYKGESGRGRNDIIIYEVQLSLKNPLRVVDDGGNDPSRLVWDCLRASKVKNSSVAPTLTDELQKALRRYDVFKNLKNYTAMLLKHGTDGFVYENGFESKGSPSFIILKPEQVRIVNKQAGTIDQIMSEFG